MTVQATTQTVTITANVPQPLTLSPPQAFGVVRKVVISNYTPFIALLKGVSNSQAQQPSLQPFTANLFTFDNYSGGIQVAWANPIAGNPAPGIPFITTDWADDDPTNFAGQLYPLSIPTGINVVTSGTVEISGGTVNVGAGTIDVQNVPSGVLLTGDRLEQLYSNTLLGVTLLETISFTALHIYSALQIIVGRTTGSIVPYGADVIDANFSGDPFHFKGGFFPITPSQWQLILPLANAAGDTIDLSIWSSGSSPSTDYIISVYGLTSCPPVPLRSDGYIGPTGAYSQTAFNNSSTGFQVVSPVVNMRLLLKHAFFSGGNVGSPIMQCTVGGNTNTIIGSAFGAPGQTVIEWEEGLLLDYNTDVNCAAAVAAAMQGSVVYDIVP